MSGWEAVREQIETLKGQLAKTKSEKRREELKREIADWKSGRICMVCGVPEVWERNHPITGRKGKKKEE